MTETVIAIDAMGGDYGPQVTVASLVRVHQERPQVGFILYGDKALIDAELAKHPKLNSVCRIEHCDMAIAMDAKPAVARRQGRKGSSMWRAIDAVK